MAKVSKIQLPDSTIIKIHDKDASSRLSKLEELNPIEAVKLNGSVLPIYSKTSDSKYDESKTYYSNTSGTVWSSNWSNDLYEGAEGYVQTADTSYNPDHTYYSDSEGTAWVLEWGTELYVFDGENYVQTTDTAYNPEHTYYIDNNGEYPWSLNWSTTLYEKKMVYSKTEDTEYDKTKTYYSDDQGTVWSFNWSTNLYEQRTTDGNHNAVDITITPASLGLSNALHFIGRATVAITDGSSTDPVISGYNFANAQSGDVILDANGAKEYIYTEAAKWEELGQEGSWATADHDHSGVYANASHTHGNISNEGTITATGIDIASGDALMLVDSSASGKLAKSSITFDGATATQALTKKGTWETFNNYTHPSATAATASAVKVGNDSSGHVVLGDALTGADIAMTGYSKASSASAIAATDTVNEAFGKIEKGLDDINGTIDSAVEATTAALDGVITGTAGAGKTLTAFSQTDGVVTATFSDISITKSQVSDFSHTHDDRYYTETEIDTKLGDKQDSLTFDGTYNSSSNKAATVSTVTSAIAALDATDIEMTGYTKASAVSAIAATDTVSAAIGKLEKGLDGINGVIDDAVTVAVEPLDATITGMGAGKTLASLSETDGIIAATFQDISITKSQVSDFPGALKNPNSLTVGSKTYDGSAAIEIVAADLGLGNALHFIGRATVAVTDGGTEDPTITNYTFANAAAGDVILGVNSDKEYVWTGSAWEELGKEGSWATADHNHDTAYAGISHTHVGSDIEMTGYEKASSISAIAATDTVSEAIGKLEKGLENINGTIDSAVEATTSALDGVVTGTAGTSKTLTVFSQTDGIVTATFGDISITKSQISDFSHTHDDRYYTETEIDTKLNNKQDALEIADTYNSSTNKVATVATVTNAIDAINATDIEMTGYAKAASASAVAATDTVSEAIGKLEKNLDGINGAIDDAVTVAIEPLDATITGAAASKTLATLTETDGIIAATFQDIAITQSQVTGLENALTGKAASSHTHNQADLIQGSGDVLIFNCGSSTVNV